MQLFALSFFFLCGFEYLLRELSRGPSSLSQKKGEKRVFTCCLCMFNQAHGLLHLLGFDHEIGGEAESEMRTAEENILRSLGWKGKGLINSAQDAVADESPSAENFAGKMLIMQTL